MRTTSLAFIVAALLTSSIPAAADDPETTGDGAAIDVGARYNEAVRLARHGDVDEALAIFIEVTRADPYWADAFYNVGSLAEHDGRHQDCALYFRRYLALAPDDPERSAIERSIASCESAIEPSGTLAVIATDPPGAAIRFEGVPFGEGALGPFVLAPGTYAIAASMPDRIDAHHEVVLSAGATVEITLELPPVPLYGSVRFDIVQQGARVLIDGEEVGVSPMTEPLRLEVGEYRVEVLKDGYHPWRRNIDVLRDLEDILEVRLIDESVDLSRYGQ